MHGFNFRPSGEANVRKANPDAPPAGIDPVLKPEFK
jgi:hypothetical protein